MDSITQQLAESILHQSVALYKVIQAYEKETGGGTAIGSVINDAEDICVAAIIENCPDGKPDDNTVTTMMEYYGIKQKKHKHE